MAAYVAIAGLLPSNAQPWWLLWAVFGTLLLLTPLYVCFIKTDPPGFAACKFFHGVTACISFTVWVFALGGPFAATFGWYQPYLGSAVLILTTLIIPVLEGQFYNNAPTTPPANPTIPPASPPSS